MKKSKRSYVDPFIVMDVMESARMAEEISDIGDVNVWCVEDAINSVANGALKLASEMPDDMYTAIN